MQFFVCIRTDFDFSLPNRVDLFAYSNSVSNSNLVKLKSNLSFFYSNSQLYFAIKANAVVQKNFYTQVNNLCT